MVRGCVVCLASSGFIAAPKNCLLSTFRSHSVSYQLQNSDIDFMSHHYEEKKKPSPQKKCSCVSATAVCDRAGIRTQRLNVHFKKSHRMHRQEGLNFEQLVNI